MDLLSRKLMMGAAAGGGASDWEALVTGDLYQGGRIRKVNSTTFQLWYYPESRKNQGISYTSSNLSGSFEVRGQSNLKIYAVGGGGGGRGENSHGGGGGGAVTVNSFTPNTGETFNFTAGAGGRGGVFGTTSPNYSGLGDGSNDSTPGNASSVVGTGINITANGGGVGNRTSNTTTTSDLGLGGTGVSTTNNRSSSTLGTGGRSGGRNFAPTAGANGGAGAGGGNTDQNSNGFDTGSSSGGSGFFGGGGGGGNGPTSSWSTNTRPGGTGNTYGFNGGYGGDTTNPFYGQSGRCPVDNPSAYPNFHAGGGRSYTAGDASTFGFNRGSAGGGGFPGGGGGSSWFGPAGLGSDGASGIVVFEWTI